MQPTRVEAAALCQFRHRHERQRPKCQAAKRRGGEIAHDNSEWMARPDLIITICGDKQRTSGVNPPTDKAQEIKRGFIRPMDVFKDDEGGPGPTSKLSQEGVEHSFPSPAVLELALELAADGSRDVSQWTQRARCRERIAHAFEYPRTDSSRASELLDECRLADACLTSNEHEQAVPSRRLTQECAQLIEICCPL
jgi:hypothetical protein